MISPFRVAVAVAVVLLIIKFFVWGDSHNEIEDCMGEHYDHTVVQCVRLQQSCRGSCDAKDLACQGACIMKQKDYKCRQNMLYFARFDGDGDDQVGPAEYVATMKKDHRKEMPLAVARIIVKNHDANRDGKLSFGEFLCALKI